MQVIANEKNKLEVECKTYHQTKVESKLLTSQINNLNEKLDSLRSLYEPRENNFILYDYKSNPEIVQKMIDLLHRYGQFRTSSSYPPLCSAQIVENMLSKGALSNSSDLRNSALHSIPTYSTN